MKRRTIILARQSERSSPSALFHPAYKQHESQMRSLSHRAISQQHASSPAYPIAAIAGSSRGGSTRAIAIYNDRGTCNIRPRRPGLY
jgi:hypothetical protein